jgi:putative copper resistance protein D
MVVLSWIRSDERDAKRSDRQAARDGDAELEEYNAHLAKLDARRPRGK